MDAGVTIQLPETVLIDPDVTAGEDTVIEPGVQLLGKTKIGARCTIRTGSVLNDAILGDDVTVEPHCVVAQSRLDDRVIIGPFAPVRIGDGAYIAAGSTITEHVPADGLGIARGRQVNKPGWAAKKRRELAATAKTKKSSGHRSKKRPRRAARNRKHR